MSEVASGEGLVLALDIGTSSVRALLFDAGGRKRGPATQLRYEQSLTPDGGVEVSAESLLDLCERCIDGILASADAHRGRIEALAISCFWHSLLRADRRGRALSPVFSWADNRAASQVEGARVRLNEARSHARLGCVIHTSYWPAKLLWIREVAPSWSAEPGLWLGFGELMRWRWCENKAMSLSMASATGLFDQDERNFDALALQALELELDELPELCDASDAATLRDCYAQRWPALRHAKVFPALGDGACANVGSNCFDASAIALSAGTSGALRLLLGDEIEAGDGGFAGAPPPGLWRYRLDSKRSLIGGAISNVGNLLDWARTSLALPEDWMRAVGEIGPDEHGLRVLPFLAGERAPLWDADARAALVDIELGTGPLELLRALLEAGALRYAAIARPLLELAPGAKVVFSGGALENVPPWRAILCDVLGAPLVRSLEFEASARGAALLALESLGHLRLSDLPRETGAVLQPNPHHHQIYAAALERQNDLYRRLRPLTPPNF